MASWATLLLHFQMLQKKRLSLRSRSCLKFSKSSNWKCGMALSIIEKKISRPRAENFLVHLHTSTWRMLTMVMKKVKSGTGLCVLGMWLKGNKTAKPCFVQCASLHNLLRLSRNAFFKPCAQHNSSVSTKTLVKQHSMLFSLKNTSILPDLFSWLCCDIEGKCDSDHS